MGFSTIGFFPLCYYVVNSKDVQAPDLKSKLEYIVRKCLEEEMVAPDFLVIDFAGTHETFCNAFTESGVLTIDEHKIRVVFNSNHLLVNIVDYLRDQKEVVIDGESTAKWADFLVFVEQDCKNALRWTKLTVKELYKKEVGSGPSGILIKTLCNLEVARAMEQLITKRGFTEMSGMVELVKILAEVHKLLNANIRKKSQEQKDIKILIPKIEKLAQLNSISKGSFRALVITLKSLYSFLVENTFEESVLGPNLSTNFIEDIFRYTGI